MPRVARIVVPQGAHHVVARGVNGCRLFRSGADKRRYRQRFAQIAAEEGVLIHGFSVLTNHVHCLLTPQQPNALARLFQRLHTWWAGFFNRCMRRTGHLFESRYYSSPVDEAHFWAALRYIELNAKRAGLTCDLAEWEHSSARAHLTGQPDEFVRLEMDALERRRWGPREWRSFLAESDPPRERTLEKCLRTGRPCGDLVR